MALCHVFQASLEDCSAATHLNFYGNSDGLLRHHWWSSMASLVDLGGLLKNLRRTFMVFQMGFYGTAGGLLHRLRWSSIAPQFRCISTASQMEYYSDSGGRISETQVDLYGISGGRMRHLRWTSKATQADLYGISAGPMRHLKWTSKETQGIPGRLLGRLRCVDFYDISSRLPRHLWWTYAATQVDFESGSGGLLKRLRLTSMASQVDFYGISDELLKRLRLSSAASQVDFYGTSGGLLKRLRWTYMASQVDFIVILGELIWHLSWSSTASRLELYGVLGGLFIDSGGLKWHLRQTLKLFKMWAFMGSQLDFFGIFRLTSTAFQVKFCSGIDGLLLHLRLTFMVFLVDYYDISCELLLRISYSSGLPRHLGQTSTTTQVTSTASQVHFYGFPGGFKWTSSLIQVDFYNNSSRILRHLMCTSTASQVDFYGFSGGLNWTFTTIQVVLQILRWSSAALQVDFYGSSGGLLWLTAMEQIRNAYAGCGSDDEDVGKSRKRKAYSTEWKLEVQRMHPGLVRKERICCCSKIRQELARVKKSFLVVGVLFDSKIWTGNWHRGSVSKEEEATSVPPYHSTASRKNV
uniref:Uncharacterized protein n=1 Tax=Ditylenchus dipsaci TaxID=166011 RepID=A0A915D2C0_9BILA